MGHKKGRYKAIVLIGFAVSWFIWFVRNVKSMAKAHLDEQVTNPVLFCGFGVILLLLSIYRKKRNHSAQDMDFIIPMIYIGIGLAAFFIGQLTPCCEWV